MKAMLKDKKANITVTYQEVVKLSNCDNEYLQFWILIQKDQNAICNWEFKIETENEIELNWMKFLFTVVYYHAIMLTTIGYCARL